MNARMLKITNPNVQCTWSLSLKFQPKWPSAHRAATVPHFHRPWLIRLSFDYNLNKNFALEPWFSHPGGHLQAPVRVGGMPLGQIGHAGSDREVGYLPFPLAHSVIRPEGQVGACAGMEPITMADLA